jgi:tetratricopeptide (TPR) repeat protein
MVKTNLIWLAALIFLTGSCGITKNKEKKGADVFSVADFPYIEKFHEGVRLKTRGQQKEAIACFEECIRLNDKDDASYYALSGLYLLQGNAVASSNYIKKAAALDPKNIWYTQELAFMYYEAENYPEAIKNFEKLIKYEPGNVEWLYGFAECLVKAGKIADAIKALDKTEDQMGIIPDLTLQKFRLYIQLKQEDKAIQEINKARAMYPNESQLLGTLVDYYFQTGQTVKAINMLEEMVKVDPENGRAQLALAEIYRTQGKKKEAYEKLKKAFRSDEVDIDTKMKILISINETPGSIDPEAIELVEIMVQSYPAEAKAYSIQGDFFMRQGKTEDALSSFKKALEFDQNQFPIWNQVLLMEYEKEDFDALYKDSKSCLSFFPTVPTVYLLFGMSANHLDKHLEAVETLEAGKELVVNDNAVESEFYGQLGEAYFGVQNISKGKENYELALKIDNKSAALKNNYAYRLAIAKSDLERALELINAALLGSSENPNFHDTKGYILFQQEKYNDALPSFEKATQLEPSSSVFVEHLGDCYFKVGNTTKAVEYWNQAKALGSRNKNIEKKIEKKQYYEPNY